MAALLTLRGSNAMAVHVCRDLLFDAGLQGAHESACAGVVDEDCQTFRLAPKSAVNRCAYSGIGDIADDGHGVWAIQPHFAACFRCAYRPNTR